jgi:hypothetical protein
MSARRRSSSDGRWGQEARSSSDGRWGQGARCGGSGPARCIERIRRSAPAPRLRRGRERQGSAPRPPKAAGFRAEPQTPERRLIWGGGGQPYGFSRGLHLLPSRRSFQADVTLGPAQPGSLSRPAEKRAGRTFEKGSLSRAPSEKVLTVEELPQHRSLPAVPQTLGCILEGNPDSRLFYGPAGGVRRNCARRHSPW